MHSKVNDHEKSEFTEPWDIDFNAIFTNYNSNDDTWKGLSAKKSMFPNYYKMGINHKAPARKTLQGSSSNNNTKSL